jgi:hypothetical protein
MFYDDAKRHMSRKMKKNLDNFENNVKRCNEFIDQINPKIREGIKAIVFEPIHGHISDEDVSSINGIVKTGYYQAIRSVDDIADAIRKWDLASKINSRGLTGKEADRARIILGTLQQDQPILNHLRGLQKKISDLTAEANIINSQATEIYSLITNHRYRAKHMCCPFLIKELWQSLF